MENESRNYVFSSSLGEWEPVNSSFDRGELRVAYHGRNQNKSSISKEVFERAIPSIFNCPVVCNYNRASDSIGAHDVDFVSNDGDIKMINITQPVGVVPESAKYSWKEVEEADGTVHEYLCVDVLMWKRQEAYQHIRDNGVTDESMEIKVASGSTDPDGYYVIDSFEFLAFCLLESARPCYESACVELFSFKDFKTQYASMMEDYKREFSAISAEVETCNLLEGGNNKMDIKEMMAKYELVDADIEGLDFEAMTDEEIEVKFVAIHNAKVAEFAGDDDVSTQSDDEETVADDDDAPCNKKFSITVEQFHESVFEALSGVRYNHPEYGEMQRYSYIDSSIDDSEIYAYDITDGRIYGFKFEMHGDNVVVDFECGKRKKACFVDYDEGDFACGKRKKECSVESDDADDTSYAKIVDPLVNAFANIKAAYDNEIAELRRFKDDRIDGDNRAAVESILNQFSDLDGDERFEALKQSIEDGKWTMSHSDIEDKCFAIRGRRAEIKFSADQSTKPIRIPAHSEMENGDEPYNGIFVKYGIVK